MSEQNDEERDDAAQSVGGSDEIDAGGYGGPGPDSELPEGKKIKSEDNRETEDDDS